MFLRGERLRGDKVIRQGGIEDCKPQTIIRRPQIRQRRFAQPTEPATIRPCLPFAPIRVQSDAPDTRCFRGRLGDLFSGSDKSCV